MNIKTRRWGLALAAVSATMALSGVGASGASAALTGSCMGTPITGVGSSLQGAAQGIWTAAGTTGFTSAANAATGTCGTTTGQVTYDVSSSGGCLTAFGASTGVLNTGVAFCGTDDAPTEPQLTTSTSVAGGARVLSIPVGQAAIAIVVNPPANCTITASTPGQLEGGLRGTTTWTGIGGTGAGCESNITRVVRNDSSGTTYQLKHYLTTVNGAVVHNGLTWAGLQSSANNQTWPGTVVKSATGCGSVATLASCTGAPGTGSGGGDEVRTVAVTSGAIGYAALSDARTVTTARLALGTSTSLKWISIKPITTNISPSTNGLSTTKAQSNCPIANSAYGTPPTATGDWSGVYETASGSAYPICTLTWDLAFNNYATAGYSGSGGKAQSVRDYLHYILLGGQNAVLNNDYQVLPGDVNTAATTGVQEITG